MTATYNEQILLSVIVPVYNAEEYLSDCLASIRKSNYQNIEVILVNDGSTDSSPSICNVYSCKDPRFKTVHIQNGGVSDHAPPKLILIGNFTTTFSFILAFLY